MGEPKMENSILPSKAAAYNMFVVAMLWIVFFKYVVSWIVVEMDPEYTVLRVIPVTWGFQVVVNATIMLKASHPRLGHLVKSCTIWTNKICPVMEELKVDAKPRNIKKHVKIVTIIGWTIVLLNTGFFAFLFLYPHTSYYTILPQLVISPLPVNMFTKIIWIVIGAYMSAASIIPVAYIINVCIIMSFAFKTCCKAVEQVTKDVEEQHSFPGSLYRQRILHLNTCLVVEMFDKDLKFFFANLCFTTIPMSCFFLYQMVKTDMDSIIFAAHAFWLAFGFVTMAMTCAYAAAMNKAAHSTLQCIYETGLEGVSLEHLGELTFFLSKLTASPIGFSILDFVVITNELVLTVGGIFLTYSVVLLQF